MTVAVLFMSILFSSLCAQNPVLVIDLDGNTNSGPAIQTAVQNNSVGVDYVTSFPTTLTGYSTVFVCLGVYNNNVTLSSTQGTSLAAFLNQGGSLYMEGGDTWDYDPPTAVHPYFNINGLEDGSANLNQLIGQSGTLSEGFSFTYTGDNSYIDQFEPIAPAMTIFSNMPTLYDCAVSYNAMTYKTIGASFEFGGLQDDTVTGNTKDELMHKYLQFLSVIASTNFDIGIVEVISPINNLNEGDTIPVAVVLKNFGSDTLSNATLAFAIDTGVAVTFAWSGSLSFNETDTVTIGELVIPSATYDLCAWTIYPVDTVLENDMICESLSINPALDAGILEVYEPTGTYIEGSLADVIVEIKNFGIDSLFAMDVAYSLNGATNVTFAWTGALAPGETDSISLTSFTVPLGISQLCAFTLLNGDQVPMNDSMCVNFFGSPTQDAGLIEIYEPSGSYTEGDTINVVVEIKNFGADTLFAMDVAYSVNGGLNVTQAWTGTLAPGGIDVVQLPMLIAPLGASQICAFTQLIGDQQTANDSLCKNFYGNPANDAGMVEILSLPQISGEYNVYARIVNSGVANLLAVDLEWTINSMAQDTVEWTGNLASNDISDLILLGSYLFSDTTYNIKVNTSMPNGASDIFNTDDTLQTDMEFIASALVDTFPYCESFEGDLGNWIQNTWDDMDWSFDSIATPTPSTGPTSAYNGTYFIYTEATPQQNGDEAGIEAMFDLSTFTYPEIAFSYHMYGNQMGSLHVDIFDSIWHEDVWVMSGNQGNQWYQASVQIYEFGNLENVVIRFRGVRGNGSRSDMALDNFCITEGIATNLSLNSFIGPLAICATASESVFVEVENLGGNTQTDIPFVLEIINPLGTTTTLNDTLWGDLMFGDIEEMQFSLVDFSLTGTYMLTCYFTLAGDQVTSNDTLSMQLQSIQTISSLPFTDSLETGNSYFKLNFSTLSFAEHTGDTLNSYLRFTGGDVNAGWSGSTTTTNAQNAWEDNVTHHSTATTCNIDATQMNGLTLEFDLKQTASFLLYSWFRVLVNDTVQLSDIFGNTNFNPTTTVNDNFETRIFNLNAYAGTNFTLTFQAACKYDNTYNPGVYPEGDQALVDNIKLFEPLTLDASVFSIVDPSGSSCGSTSLPINIVLANYGLSDIFNIPVEVTITFPDNSTQFLSAVFMDTIQTGQMVNYTVGSVNTSTMPGNYEVTVSSALVGDGDLTNNSQMASFHAVGMIDAIPFEEMFPTAGTDYFTVTANSLASAYYFNDNGDTVLRLEGKTNASWTGTSGNVTPTNAWINNVEHQSNVNTCGVDASGYTFLNLDIDFRQTGITNITDYSWFRVLVNDTIQLTDVFGESNFNPTNAQGDPYQIGTFSLNQFAGTQFTLTLQSSCKYDSTLTASGTTWVEGDAVYIRNIRIYEPPPVDIWVTGLIGVPDPSCGLGVAPLTVEFTNNGTDTIPAGTVIPFNLEFNGGITILEGMTLANALAYNEASSYTFSFQPDYSADGEYEIIVWSALTGDLTFVNDTAMAYTNNILTVDNFPYVQDFESNSDGWVSETIAGLDGWELGDPEQTLLDTAHSGINAWMTDLIGDYPSNAEMHLYSPCFNFSGMQNVLVSFWLNFDSEVDYDGMILEGSSDGLVWSKVGLNDANFYNSNNNAAANPVLDAPWWSGTLGGWTKITGTLNEFAGESGVRLRFRFKADNGVNSEGFAMDDFYVDELFACNISGQNEICEGESVALLVDASGGEVPYTYQWVPATGLSNAAIADPMASPVTTTTYSVIVTDALGEQAVSEFTITVNPAPYVDLGADIIGNPPFVLDAGVGFTSYLWSNLETDQAIVVSQTGLYSVTVTDAVGCQGSDTIIVTILGINEMATGSVSIYPNPTAGIFTCSFNLTLIEEANLFVTNILGEIVHEQILPGVSYNQKINLNLSELAEGTYLLYLRNDQVNQVQKLIIQK